MAKKYLYTNSVAVPLYRGYIIIIFTNSKKKLKKYAPEMHLRELYAYSCRIERDGALGHAMVLNFDSKVRKMNPGCVAHEIVHCVNSILDYAGVLPSFENDEPTAYLTDWVTDQVYKFMDDCDLKTSFNG